MRRGTIYRYALVGLWAGGIVAGLAGMAVYANRPGGVATSSTDWPAGLALSRPHGKAVLIVALHPACGCSQATLEQINRIVGWRPGSLDVIALVAEYKDLPPDADVLGPALAGMTSLRRVVDRDARVAGRFGALTSGHAFLYDGDGHLRFSGGLTAARGHAGDSAGLDFVRGWIEGRRLAAPVTLPVFGCALGHVADASAS